jgi:hypothetical protein
VGSDDYECACVAEAVKDWWVNGTPMIMDERVEIFIYQDGKFVGISRAAEEPERRTGTAPRPNVLVRLWAWIFGDKVAPR